MRFFPLVPHGFSKARLRARRAALEWQGLVQIHHVVPRSLRRHPVLRAHAYDVEAEYNMVLLPTHAGVRALRLRPERPVHDGGHSEYNRFALQGLDACAGHGDFVCLLTLLHLGCRGLLRVPWR